jgi:signal peptidase I
LSNPNSREERTASTEGKLFSRENIQTVVVALLLAFVIRTFVAEARFIPSGSMEPTLMIDDRLIVEKLTFDFTKPTRGQIIVFMPPPTAHSDQAFIKRLIGMPGDTIEIANGQVIINGVAQKEPYIAEPPNYYMPKITVPEGNYFMMGDNRNNSADSHIWGFLPRENIIGHAVFRFWPLNRLGGL